MGLAIGAKVEGEEVFAKRFEGAVVVGFNVTGASVDSVGVREVGEAVGKEVGE